MPSHISRRTLVFRAAMITIGMLAFVLRTYHLGAKGLWLDEGVSIALARMSWSDMWDAIRLRETNMSLYYIFLRGWQCLGSSEVFLRIPNVVFASLSIVVFGTFARHLFGRKAAIVCSVLLTFSVLHIRASRELRGYGLLLFLLAVSWWAFGEYCRTRSRKALLVWAIVSILAAYCHYFAALIVLAQIACVPFIPDCKTAVQGIRTASLCIFLGWIPLCSITANALGEQLQWVPRMSWETLRLFCSNFGNGDWWMLWFLLFVVALVLACFRTNNRLPLAIAISGTVIPVTAVALISLKSPMFLSRYLIVALPCFLLTISGVIAQFKRHFAIIVLLVLVIAGLPALRKLNNELSWTETRELVQCMQQRAQLGDAVLIWGPMERASFDYYSERGTSPGWRVLFPSDPSGWRGMDIEQRPDPKVFSKISKNESAIWVIFEGRAEPRDYSIYQHFFLRTAGTGRAQISHVRFNGVELYEFRKPASLPTTPPSK